MLLPRMLWSSQTLVKEFTRFVFLNLAMVAMVGAIQGISQGMLEKILSIKTCGRPNIQNIMNNVTAKPGQSAMFKCQVDMTCLVAYIEWYHEMDNGTEKLIKTAGSSGDPHVHIIKHVKDTDKGLYTCIAGNVMGQATASAYLEVNGVTSMFRKHNNFLLMLFCTLLSVFMSYSSLSSWNSRSAQTTTTGRRRPG